MLTWMNCKILSLTLPDSTLTGAYSEVPALPAIVLSGFYRNKTIKKYI
jgi:hypothetical protein